MASGNHTSSYYAASISFTHQSTHYFSGDKRPRNLFEADYGNGPTLPSFKRQRRVEGLSNQGHGILLAAGRGSLQGVFGGDDSSRVVELDDSDMMEDIDQHAGAPTYQQSLGCHPPVLKNNPSDSYGHTQGRHVNALPYSTRTLNQQPVCGPGGAALPHQGYGAVDGSDRASSVNADSDIHARYRPHPPANTTYGMGDGYIQRPSVYSSDNTRAYIGSAPARSQQQPPPPSTYSTTPSYAYTSTRAYDPPPVVDAGLGSSGNVDSSVYRSQWSTQEGYYDWQRGAQDADAIKHGHAVTDNQHLEGSTSLHQSDQHILSPVYEDADFNDEFLDFLRSNSVQQGSHNEPTGVRDARVAYADESQFINQPGLGQHGSKDQLIELDDPEEELDDALEFTDNHSSNRSYQPVHVNSNVGTDHPGTVPVTSSVGMSALGASRQSNRQSLHPGGTSHGPTYPQQVQSTAATRPSDADLAKNHANKKENKAKEIAFKDQGRWWHRMNGNVAAVPAIQHSEIANQLRTTANSRGSYQYAPEKGESEDDRLAFVPTHMNWGETRAHRPNELFTFYKPDNRPAACEPQRWIYNGQRVLDHKGKWMWYYDDVPVTIPSVIKGWRLEIYFRRNPSLTLADIQGRMPKVFKTNIRGRDIEEHGPWDDTALRNRMMRFRWQACLITWTRKENCDITKKYFENFLEQSDKENNTVVPGFRVRNSTRVLGRDLTTREVNELKRKQKAAKAKTSAAASTETSEQDGNEGTPSEADENAPPVHQSGIRSMTLLNSAMPIPPTAATRIDYVEDFGDPTVGNRDEDHYQQNYGDGHGRDLESSKLPTWPRVDSTTVNSQTESTRSSPKLSSGSRRFWNKLQSFCSADRAHESDRSTTQQPQTIVPLPRHESILMQSDPTGTKASSGTSSPVRKRPFDEYYDVSPERSPDKKTRTTNSAHSGPSLGRAFQNVQTNDARVRPERIILKPSGPSSTRQNIQRPTKDGSRQPSARGNGPQIYPTAPIHRAKRSFGSEEGPRDLNSEEASQKRPANGQMLPPLVSASGVVVGKPDTQRQPERRSFSTKARLPLRKKALQQSFRVTNGTAQTEQTAVPTETTKAAEGSKPTLLPSPVITERKTTSPSDRSAAPITADSHASTALDSQQLGKAQSGDKDRQSTNATARSPRKAAETGLADKPLANASTGPGIATNGPGQNNIQAARRTCTPLLHLENGASLRPAAEMDYTHLQVTPYREASPEPAKPAGDHIASHYDFPLFDFVVTEAGAREYNRVSALIEQIETTKCLTTTESSEALNNDEQDPIEFTFRSLEPVNVDFKPQGYQTPEPPEEPSRNCQACGKPTEGWMVQCSKTSHSEDEGWYHFHCAGLTEKDCEELDEWFCPVCRPRAAFAPIPGRRPIGGKGLGPTPPAALLRQPSPRVSTNNGVMKSKAQASPRKEKQGPSRRRALERELADLPDYWSKEEDFAWGAERGPKMRRAAAKASSSRTGDVDSRSIRRSTRNR